VAITPRETGGCKVRYGRNATPVREIWPGAVSPGSGVWGVEAEAGSWFAVGGDDTAQGASSQRAAAEAEVMVGGAAEADQHVSSTTLNMH